MNNYFFLLGRTPELSLKELSALVGKENVAQLSPEIAQVSLASDEEAVKVFHQLGGCLKVMKHEGEFSDLETEELTGHAAAYLAQFEKPTFALAELHRDNKEKVALTRVKSQLRDRGVSSRFIEGPREGLSASVLLHQEVTELFIIRLEEKLHFAKTLAVQDIDDWTRRDRGKPYADKKKGMLPPKVARMMVNIAMGSAAGGVLYDPFCGSGTVLMEAMMRGCEVVGSDLDKNAVEGTQDNLEWFAQEFADFAQATHVFQTDVAAVTPQQVGKQIDYLVTEPFLGKPTPKPEQLPNIFRGLEKMYLGAFKQWMKILKNDAKVVIIFPYTTAGKQVFSLENLIDKLAGLGYTPLSEPALYHRPQAIVQRQIWEFEFKK